MVRVDLDIDRVQARMTSLDENLLLTRLVDGGVNDIACIGRLRVVDENRVVDEDRGGQCLEHLTGDVLLELSFS